MILSCSVFLIFCQEKGWSQEGWDSSFGKMILGRLGRGTLPSWQCLNRQVGKSAVIIGACWLWSQRLGRI